MDPQKAVDLPIAKHGLPVAQKTSVVIIIARDGEDSVSVYTGESKSPENLLTGDLEDQDAQIEQYVTEQLQRNPQKKHVLVMCEQGLKTRHFHRVRLAAGRALEEGEPHYVAIMEEP